MKVSVIVCTYNRCRSLGEGVRKPVGIGHAHDFRVGGSGRGQ